MEGKVSIIVPVYNAKDYLEECLNSLLAQTYSNLEIILVDDGSQDESGKICDSYRIKDSRIIVVHQKNTGVSAARNKALDIATGEYIMFCDSDDLVAPQWVEMHVAAQKKYPNSTISSQFKLFYDEVTIENFKDLKLDEIDYWNLFIGDLTSQSWNKIFAKNIIDKYKLRFDLGVPIGEDTVFVAKYMRCLNKFCILQNPLYYYRQVETSAMHKYNSRSFEYSLKTFYARVPLITSHDLIKYCDHWLCEFIKLLNNVFDDRNKVSFWSKVRYNRRMLASKEMRFCLEHATGKNENRIILFLVKHNLPLIYRLMQIGYKTFRK